MEREKRETFTIIGLGKVGTSIGFLIRKAGYEIKAIADLSEEALKRAHPYTGGYMTTNVLEGASMADCIIITTVDDEIEKTCRAIAVNGGVKPGQKYIHMSGAGALSLLQEALERGAQTACIHPLQSFASIEGAIASIPGSIFGITASDPSMAKWAQDFVRRLGGVPFFIADGEDKTLYHIAACMASNYLTTLMNFVKSIYRRLGMDEDMAIKSILPLVRGTIKNIEDNGTVQALTGPIARGDVGTIRGHLSVLEKLMPDLLPYYCLLGLATVKLAEEKGVAPKTHLETIEVLMKGDKL
ncbi:MAG: DUF2520 domain-containing protein [Syntrophales bacterium]|nr:DUF2520 domain-containing protein [Syntrophales bacterium]